MTHSNGSKLHNTTLGEREGERATKRRGEENENENGDSSPMATIYFSLIVLSCLAHTTPYDHMGSAHP